MSKPVDVFVTTAELEEGRKVKKTTCMKIDHATLKPVHCVSKPGVSSGMLFAAPEPRRVGRYLTNSEMAVMYDKFVGPSSLNNAAVRHEQAERERSAKLSPANSIGGSASAAPRATEPRTASIDSGDRTAPSPSAQMAVVLAAAGGRVTQSQIKVVDLEAAAEKAAVSATMKYVAPAVAKKYGITQSFTPASVRAASASSRGSTAAYRAGGAKGGGGGGGGAAAAAGDRLQGEASTASSDGVGVVQPRPPSAAFAAVPRDKAQRTGSHFVYGGNGDVPAPGKYTPRYGATDKAQPALSWSKPPLAPGDAAAAASTAEAGADGDAAAAGGRGSRPSSAPAHVNAASAFTRRAPQGAPPQRGFVGPNRSSSNGAGGGAGTGTGAAGRPASASHAATARRSYSHGPHHGPLNAEAKAQLQHRHEELFGAAHRVHPRKEYVPGSQPFKVVGRGPLFDSPATTTLFGEYYKEGYDSLTRRSSRPSSAFLTQTERQWANGPLGETGPCVGPGSYAGQEVPATNTGRHVPSGHPSLSRTPDWTRTTPRPCSAPPVRPPPAAAVQQGYWGPEGPATSLFPDEPDYSELVSVRYLQEHTSQREPSGGGLPPRRAPSHQISQRSQAGGGGTGPFAGSGGAVAATAATDTDTAAAAAGTADSKAGGSKAVDERPASYVTADRLSALSSAGLAKRVPGGTFSNVTRDGSCHAMRVMSSNKVIAPASVTSKTAQDLSYEYDYAVEAHRSRPPAWQLPPNRNALSQQWMVAAATEYLS